MGELVYRRHIHSVGPMGRIHSNFGEAGNQAYLVLSSYCDYLFRQARHITSEALQVYSSGWSLPGLVGKTSEFKGVREWMWKEWVKHRRGK